MRTTLLILILFNVSVLNAQFYGHHRYEFNGGVESCLYKAHKLISNSDTFKFGDFIQGESVLTFYNKLNRLTSIHKSSSPFRMSEKLDSLVFNYKGSDLTDKKDFIGGVLKRHTKYEFDSTKTILTRSRCVADTNEFIIQHTVYTTNDNGEVIRKKEKDRHADSCQEWITEMVYIYSDDGLLIEEQPSSEYLDTCKYSYDQHGFLIFMNLGFIPHYRYVNNSSGQPIQKYEVMPGENERLSVEYSYNSNGFQESEKWIKKDAIYKTITLKYKYDSKNNWIEKVTYESDEYNRLKAKSIITRKIKYYD